MDARRGDEMVSLFGASPVQFKYGLMQYGFRAGASRLHRGMVDPLNANDSGSEAGTDETEAIWRIWVFFTMLRYASMSSVANLTVPGSKRLEQGVGIHAEGKV